MTELQSSQRRSFTAKTIFGLLLAIVMVGAFATAGSAQNTGSPRGGELHVTKECSQNQGRAGDFCTILGSNLNAIQAGMKVIYIDAAGPFGIGDFGFDTDIVLDGPGNNNAYGHVVLSFVSGTGTVTFSSGTGRFSGFHTGDLAVTCACGPNDPTPNVWSWAGPYSFTPPGHDK
jgi:hypothetical protein